MNKLNENKKRDYRQVSELRKQGWKVLVVWQCQLKETNVNRTFLKVVTFLEKGTR